MVALPRLLNEYINSLPADVLDQPSASLLLPPAVAAHLALLQGAPAPAKPLPVPQDADGYCHLMATIVNCFQHTMLIITMQYTHLRPSKEFIFLQNKFNLIWQVW